MANIFIDLELFIDPPITDDGAMREHLAKERIPDWNKRINNEPRCKVFAAKAKEYIEGQLPQLEQQGKEARAEKYAELKEQADRINAIGVTELSVKNLVNNFKKFFREDTIRKLVPLESSSSKQSDEEFVIPECPDTLKCDKPVSYVDMCAISFDLGVAGEYDSLYKLLECNEREETANILIKARAKDKEIHNISPKDFVADAKGRLAGRFMSYFKDDNERKKYDIAVKRFRFDEYADKILAYNVKVWSTKNETDWKQYHDCIDEVVKKKLGYSQEEAAWLVYEYFCIRRKCPLPKKPKKGAGWGKHEQWRLPLIFLFEDSIKYHELSKSNPRIKSKLQSIIRQFNEITDPDSVERILDEIIKKDLPEFCESCKYDGIVSNPLFKPTTLTRFPFPELLQQNFIF